MKGIIDVKIYILCICILLFINRNEGGEELTYSVDAGWQKCGSERSFDSLSGNIQILSGTRD